MSDPGKTAEEPAEKSVGLSAGTHLLVRAGEYVCALPLVRVRRVVRALSVFPLPGAAPVLKGLTEFGGEPLPILDLARLVRAPLWANPPYPVTVVVWAGPAGEPELLGLAADAALELAPLPPGGLAGGDGGLIAGEAWIGGRAVRVLNLEALGRDG